MHKPRGPGNTIIPNTVHRNYTHSKIIISMPVIREPFTSCFSPAQQHIYHKKSSSYDNIAAAVVWH